MSSKVYSRKILDPRWQKKRLIILNRDNFTCLICGSTTDELHVHHERYYGDPWDVDEKFLKTLCYKCHYLVELCKKLKLKPHNINLIPFSQEFYYYLVNVIHCENEIKINRLHLFHNKSGDLRYSGFSFTKELLELMLKTF